jgi:hypothetical protein
LTGAACNATGGGTSSDAQDVVAAMKLGPSDLSVVGAVDRADDGYRTGEPVVLTVEVNKPAYVAVLRVLPNGATTLVFPNRAHPQAQVAANSPLRIPDAGSATKITAATSGTVLFEFIAATRGGSWLFTREPEGSADFAELGVTTRALAKDIVTSLQPSPGSATAAAHIKIRVSDP